MFRNYVHYASYGENSIDYLEEAESEMNEWIEENNAIIIDIKAVTLEKDKVLTYITYIEVTKRALLTERKKD